MIVFLAIIFVILVTWAIDNIILMTGRNSLFIVYRDDRSIYFNPWFLRNSFKENSIMKYRVCQTIDRFIVERKVERCHLLGALGYRNYWEKLGKNDHGAYIFGFNPVVKFKSQAKAIKVLNKLKNNVLDEDLTGIEVFNDKF